LRDQFNQYTFVVADNANRVEIRRAVEEIFNVRVVGVKTMRVKGKRKRRGRIIGKRRDWKKAIIRLAPGQRIESFEGA
jgi:large subunit ribosomal protein L23